MSLPLVLTTTQLQQHLTQLETDGKTLADAGFRLVDLRSAEAYAAGHIKGAVNVSPALLNRSDPPMNGLMPEPSAVNDFLRSIGARMGDQIIAYDGGLETPAARLVWVMDAYGYEVCSWLSGGFKAWVADDNPVSTEPVTTDPGSLELSLIGDNVISVDNLVAELDNPTLKILDVRSAGEYEGKDIRAAHSGHVPGAKHAEWTSMLDDKGRLLDDSTLEKNLGALIGSDHDDTVVVYCQTHQRSSVTYVALKHLGYPDVRAIDGAWSAWGNRQDTPKHTS
ncbi:MAG: sulfurtransferase [Granulosicoccus sp.]